MEEMKNVLLGDKKSSVCSALSNLECLSTDMWATIRTSNQIPEGFLFLAGVVKYAKKNHWVPQLRVGKELVFIQNMRPHQDSGHYRSRGYGALYSLYEPDKLADDDLVLEESAIYEALPDNHLKLILANGECRKVKCIADMFEYIRQQRGFQDFAPEGALPKIFEVTLKTKSCGYFLKNRTYLVWATPIGIPDKMTGEIAKGWLLSDIYCGVPAIMSAEREEFIPLEVTEGSKVGIFTMREGNLIYEQ